MEQLNVLVTGGARGIGAGIVEKLAEAGHNVAFCGRGEITPEIEKKIASLKQHFNVCAAYYRCDIAKAADREAMLNAFEADFGLPDVLVNNAGIAPKVRADLLDMSEESFNTVMNVNLASPFFLTQLAAKKIMSNKDNKFHAIINICSVSADYASINRGEYCMSKAAVAMATKLWSVRLADEGVAVYELRPGVIMSDMTSVVKEKYDGMIANGLTLQRRWGFPEDVGKAVTMLVSGALAYSTGQVINIDGGLTVERF